MDVHGNIYILDRVNHRVAKFDAGGIFVVNVAYDPGWDIIDLAADSAGRVYLLDCNGDVRVLEQGGSLLQEYHKPAGMNPVRDIKVDKQGVLWIVGDASSPNAPVIEQQPCAIVTVPLGNAQEVFDVERQKSMTVPGWLLDLGGPVFTYYPLAGSPGYLYNQQGQRIYEMSPVEQIVGIDPQGNLYTTEDNVIRVAETDKRVNCLHKYDPKGYRIASLALSTALAQYTETLLDQGGTAYTLVWDFNKQDIYRIIRWQRK